jgi:AraC-like DNA-binding protein
MGHSVDIRKWVATDRPGERVTVGQPISGVEVLSATGSTRHWSEPLHSTFTVAIVHPGEPPTAAEWSTRGRSVTTAGGELMNINAGDGHTTFRVHAPSAFDAVKLAPFWLDDAARELLPQRQFRFRSPTCRNATVFQAVQRLVRGISRGQDPFELESTCHEVARAIVMDLAETLPRASEPSDLVRDPRLRRVRDYLLEESSSRPTLQALENDTGLGKSQLCALFKKGFGISMGQFWTGCRITKAKALLLDGIPAKSVAADLGFSDEAYFSRTFRRYNGLPPGSWVNLYRANSLKSG